jgi:polyisoprenoid-binding protein YceI
MWSVEAQRCDVEAKRNGVTKRQRKGVQVATLLSLIALVPAGSRAAESRSWKVSEGDVRVICPMTIGGSFETKTRALSGALTLVTPRPPAFKGSLSVALDTLDTGIALRNHHLRDKYLEVGKGEGFATAVLSDIRLGDVDPDTFQGRTTFSGSFTLHGVTKPVSGDAEIRRDGASVRISASFAVTIPDFGIEKPRYLGVGVKDRVEVHILLVATPVAGGGGAQ